MVFLIFTIEKTRTMEVKTLLRLVKDDIAHLEGITSDFLLESLPSSDEVELALVRANALLRELELLRKIAVKHEHVAVSIELSDVPNDETPQQEDSGQDHFELFTRENNGDTEALLLIPVQQDEPEDPDDFEQVSPIIIEERVADLLTSNVEPDETFADTVEEPMENLEEATFDREETTEVTSAIIEVEAVPEHEAEILAEEFKEVKKTLNESLGESHQMVNDILSPEKDETGYKIVPINSIWDGIGINDRFLFIRELFANSSAKLENTVTALDHLDSIQDAVTYLKMNFKWNKAEASQKFLVLVKRRFAK